MRKDEEMQGFPVDSKEPTDYPGFSIQQNKEINDAFERYVALTEDIEANKSFSKEDIELIIERSKLKEKFLKI